MRQQQLAEATKQILEEIARRYRDDETVRQEPDVYLLSLLLAIQEDLSSSSAITKLTVQTAGFKGPLEKARMLLNREVIVRP